MSCTAPQILIKQPSETRRYEIQFNNLMSTTESILTGGPAPSVTSEQRGGGTSDLSISGVSVSGQSLLFWISGGTHSYTYRVEAVIGTDGLQTLEGDGLLRVTDKGI
jgi:hypothetical protein